MFEADVPLSFSIARGKRSERSSNRGAPPSRRRALGVQCQLRNSAASEFSRCGRRRALARFEAARRRRPVPLLPHRRRRGWKLTRAQPGHSLRSPQSAAVMSSTARRSCHMVTGRAAGSSRYASHGGRGQLSRQRRTLVTCVLVRVVRREEVRI